LRNYEIIFNSNEENESLKKLCLKKPTSILITSTDQDILDSHPRVNHQRFYRLPWVIGLKNNFGIIRCHHLDKEITIRLLQSIKYLGKIKSRVKIETLGTTGTIRSARKKYLDKLTLYPSNTIKTK